MARQRSTPLLVKGSIGTGGRGGLTFWHGGSGGCSTDECCHHTARLLFLLKLTTSLLESKPSRWLSNLKETLIKRRASNTISSLVNNNTLLPEELTLPSVLVTDVTSGALQVELIAEEVDEFASQRNRCLFLPPFLEVYCNVVSRLALHLKI